MSARIEALLPQVSKPARYLGTEIGVARKPWPADSSLGVTWLLILPEVYEIGMSHQGLRILYDLLNRRSDALAERAFAPWFDMEERMRAAGIPLFSLESRRPARDFDVLGFSLQYELLATNVLNMLDLAGIPLLARDRREDDPLIAAGGPCTGNPEPVADLFDFILIGDGEERVGAITESLRQHQGRTREARLLALAQLPGIYVPCFYTPVMMAASAEDCEEIGHASADDPVEVGRRPDGPRPAATPGGPHQSGVRPLRADVPAVIRRTYLESLREAPYPAEPLVPLIEAVQDRLTLEIQRGCTHGCRFCQAGIFYRPLRERPPAALVELIRSGLPASGWDEISLSSLSSADYSQIRPLAETLVNALSGERIGLSLSSLRIDTFSVELAELVARVRKSGFTFAPEAGSQRLRNVINKGVREEDLLTAVEAAYAKGWQRVKLYFMLGLPTETEEDVADIVTLVGKVRSIARRYGGSRKVTVSVGAFIPKAHTPFQWEACTSRERLIQRGRRLRDAISSRWSTVRFHDPDVSRIEAILSRGDRRLSAVLLAVWRRGARFDGWSDHFDPDRWQAAFGEAGLDPEHYLGAIAHDRGLPWDHIDLGVSRSFLARERDRAYAGAITPDCRGGHCHQCGVGCLPGAELADPPAPEQWARMEARVRAAFPRGATQNAPQDAPQGATDERPEPRLGYRLTFAKRGRLRFISHLETMKLIQRIMRMTRWPLAYSAGHNPHPKISFGPPLPLGVEGGAELMDVTLLEALRGNHLCAFNERAPQGLLVSAAVRIQSKSASLAAEAVEGDYEVRIPADLRRRAEREERVEAFIRAGSVIVVKASKGRQKTVDLKRCVSAIDWNEDLLLLRLRLQERSGHVLGVLHVLRELFKWTDLDLGRCQVLRRCLLRGDGSPLEAPTTHST